MSAGGEVNYRKGVFSILLLMHPAFVGRRPCARHQGHPTDPKPASSCAPRAYGPSGKTSMCQVIDANKCKVTKRTRARSRSQILPYQPSVGAAGGDLGWGGGGKPVATPAKPQAGAGRDVRADPGDREHAAGGPNTAGGGEARAPRRLLHAAKCKELSTGGRKGVNIPVGGGGDPGPEGLEQKAPVLSLGAGRGDMIRGALCQDHRVFWSPDCKGPCECAMPNIPELSFHTKMHAGTPSNESSPLPPTRWCPFPLSLPIQCLQPGAGVHKNMVGGSSEVCVCEGGQPGSGGLREGMLYLQQVVGTMM